MKKSIIGLGLLVFASHAMAHTGHGANEWLVAFTHPMTGLDHLAIFFATGFFVAQSTHGRVFKLFTLMLLMGFGMFLGQVGFYAPMVEAAIACSMIAIGALAIQHRLPASTMLFTALGLSVVLHGMAHGVLLQSVSIAQSVALGAMMLSGAFIVSLLGFYIGNNGLVSKFDLHRWLAACMLVLGANLVWSG